MVKVLAGPETLHTQCQRCKAVLSYTIADAKCKIVGDVGSRKIVSYIHCPCCKNAVIVEG